MGAGVLETNDCRATYEELKAKGVQFKSEPKEQFYGIECIVTDGCGNWFSMTQPKEDVIKKSGGRAVLVPKSPTTLPTGKMFEKIIFSFCLR